MSKILLFCCNIGFVAIYVLLWQICFVAIYALLCGEKIIKKLRMWRKNDKYQVWVGHPTRAQYIELSKPK